MLLQLPLESLRERVAETVRKHWVAPRFDDCPVAVPRARVDEVSRAALDSMLTRQFRVGPLPPAADYTELLDRVRRKVRRNQPLFVTVGYGPLKNQNAVPYSRADWAEFFTLSHLAAWHNKVQAVYAPGLQLRIVFDDATLVMANRADKGLMKSYMASVDDLIRVLGYQRLFLPSFGHSSFAWIFHLGIYALARWRVRRWERDPANRDQLERMNEYARRNVTVPAELGPEEQERYLRESSHRYRVYWQALQISRITQNKNRLVAMYLDGSQHHVRQTGALHLTSLDKGQVTQPWQGEGALLDNGHGKLEPFVLTRARRAQHTLKMVDGLSVVPGADFGQIAVARVLREHGTPPRAATPA